MAKRKRRKPAPVGRSAVDSVRSREGAAGSRRSSGSHSDQSVGNSVSRRLRRKTNHRAEPLLPAAAIPSLPIAGVWLVAIVALFLFAFWPTLVWLETQWRNEPDYSHGYIVIPLSIALLWMRWDSFPGLRKQVDWRGLSLIGLAIGMRVLGRLAYMDFMDGWALVPLVAGICWLLCGWPATRWAAPAILFLIMLVTPPYRAESLLSWNLQGVATSISTAMLRIIGQPAIAEGHTIWVGDNQLMIEQACSGLRIFVGMFALAFFWAATVKRSWLDRVVVLAAVVPMALFVNSLRITVTGYLYGWFTSPGSRHVIHDWSGYLMIPAAAGLLWLVKVFWERLYRPVTIHDPAQRLRQPTVAVES